MNLLPIANYPSVVEDFLPHFEESIRKPQLKQFARLARALSLMFILRSGVSYFMAYVQAQEVNPSWRR